jgi:photosystem II stability/assembly factor-like uncharacterized protein
MKKYVYLFFLLFLVVTTNAQIAWEPTGLTALCPSLKISVSGTIFAGSSTGDVFKSIDNGANWTSSNIGAAFNIADIAIGSNGYMFLSTSQNGVYRSSNEGTTWQHLTMTTGIEARDLEIKSGTIFASTKDNGLAKSTDNGDTWVLASSSVPESNVGAFTVTENGSLLLGVKGSNGLYRSTDDGVTWTLTNFPTSYRVYSLTVASNNIFAGTGEYLDGIYKSIDDGATWQKLSNASTSYEYKSDGIFTSNGTVLLGVLGTGIYGSTDMGNTWQLYNTGLQSLYGFVLAQASNGTVFATSGAGVFKSTGTTDTEKEGTVINSLQLGQNFPNPFNPNTNIHYALGSTQLVSLKVYDVLGNEVATLVNEEQQAGVNSVNFNASQLGSGVYFYRLETGDFAETKSMILIK